MSVWNTGPNSSESPDAICGETQSVCSARSNGSSPWVSSTSFCHSRLLSRVAAPDQPIQLASSSVYQRLLTFQARPTSGQMTRPPPSGCTVQ